MIYLWSFLIGLKIKLIAMITDEKIKEIIAEVVNEEIQEVELEDEIEVETTTRSDYITAAYFAISSVESMDTQIMSREDSKRIKRIIRKSIKIIDDCIGEMHDELFEEDEDS